MSTLDLLASCALLSFSLLWLSRGTASAPGILWGIAGLALVLAVVLISQGRWQAGALVVASLCFLGLLTAAHAMHWWLRPSWAPVTGTIALVLSVIAVAPLYLFPVRALPEPTGPHPVGVHQFEIQYQPEATQTIRRVPVRVWYPSQSAAAGNSRTYFTAREAEVIGKSWASTFGLPGFLFDHLRLIPTHGHQDASVANASTRFPVLIYNHGFGLYNFDNTALSESLASHGYVIYSIGHPGSDAGVVYTDGSAEVIAPELLAQVREGGAAIMKLFAPEKMQSVEDWYAIWDQYVRIGARSKAGTAEAASWEEDSRQVLTALKSKQLPAIARLIADASDLANRAYAGMSRGGAVAVSLCQGDEGCRAVINLDGANHDPNLVNVGVRAPLLLMYADQTLTPQVAEAARKGFAHSDFAYEDWATAGERSDVHRLFLAGSMHLGFTDCNFFYAGPLRSLLGVGPLAPDRLRDITQESVRGFLDRYLKGGAEPFPAPQLKRHPELSVQDVSFVRRWAQQRQGAVTE